MALEADRSVVVAKKPYCYHCERHKRAATLKIGTASGIFICVLLTLANCAGPAPTQAELQTGATAMKPSSWEAAQSAVKKYFARSLFDPDAAQYRFPVQPINGQLTMGTVREFGWFMCGQINGKNRMGGFVGYHPFIVYFSPNTADTVQDCTLSEGDDLPLVAGWCKGLYGSDVFQS
jgi:hypothetical protein